MAVYVDDLFDVHPAMVTGRWPYRQACHLTADGDDELHAFAARLGLRRSWAQAAGTPKAHYDLTPGKRGQAVKLGAVEITQGQGGRQLWERIKAAQR